LSGISLNWRVKTAASCAAAWPPTFSSSTLRQSDLLPPEKINDLPEGAARYIQGTKGIHYTIVNGSVPIKNSAHAGGYQGKVLRSV
jgi:hypothetical protein